MIVDGHTHVASRDTDRYPLQPTGVGRPWFTDGFGVDVLLAAMDDAAVDQAVVVQAVGAYGFDCRYAVDAVASAPDRLALVAAADPDAPDVPDAATLNNDDGSERPAIRPWPAGAGAAWSEDDRPAHVPP